MKLWILTAFRDLHEVNLTFKLATSIRLLEVRILIFGLLQLFNNRNFPGMWPVTWFNTLRACISHSLVSMFLSHLKLHTL